MRIIAEGLTDINWSDRTSDTLASWLRDHPGIEIITRDRAGAYAEGATQGAAEAVQVADRWHILKNLGDALSRVFVEYPQALRPITSPTEAGQVPKKMLLLFVLTEAAQHQRRNPRQTGYGSSDRSAGKPDMTKCKPYLRRR